MTCILQSPGLLLFLRARSKMHVLRPVTWGSHWLLLLSEIWAGLFKNRSKPLICWNKPSLHWAAAVLWWDTSSELAKLSTGSSAESAWNIFLTSQLLQHPVNGAVRWGTYACNTSFQQAHLVSLTLIFHCILPVAGVSYRLKQSPELFLPPKYSFCTRFCYQVYQMNQLEDSVSVKMLPSFELFLAIFVTTSFVPLWLLWTSYNFSHLVISFKLSLG